MQAIKSTSHLVGTAKSAVGVRKFANAGSNPSSKDMSKANWAGDKINSSAENKSSVIENNPFKQEEDLHARDLDEQTREAMLRNIFPREDTNAKNSSIDWSKKEKKTFTDPAHSALDKIAEGVEKRGAKASEKFQAPKNVTESAANFASGADRAAHAFDGVRQASYNMSSVGARIADMAHAPSIGNDPAYGQKTTTASMGEGEAETRDKSMDSTSGGMMDSVKQSLSGGMEKFTEKMTDMGSSISGKMKPLENLGEKIHVPTEMPQSIKNARESLKNATESIKDHLPKSMEEAKDMVKNVMPSMDGAKNMAASAKDKIESAMPSTGSMTSSAKSAMGDAKEKWNETKEAAMDKYEDVKDSMPSSGSMASSAKSAMQGAQEKWSEVKDAAKDKFEDAKESMPSKSQMKGMAADASDKMSQAKDYVAEKATEAKQTVDETVAKVNASGVIEQFKQGMATVKEAMKPIVDYSSEKIREGAAVAAEKIPPMAQNLKESIKSGASAVMHSSTVESVKENLSSSANKAYEKAKDSASTIITGKSEAAKMDIQEETTTVTRGGKKDDSTKNLKDQEMSSSDIYKP